MHFQSHTPFAWVAKDRVPPRYVRFRLIPGDRAPDPQTPPLDYVDHAEKDPAMAPVLADQGRASPADMGKNPNYLHHEWSGRLKEGPVRYILQIQLHEARSDDPPEILNPLLPWDDATPVHRTWRRSRSSRSCRTPSNEWLAFDAVNHRPGSRSSVLPAKSLDDLSSLNYMRAQVPHGRSGRAFRRSSGCSARRSPTATAAPPNYNPPGM